MIKENGMEKKRYVLMKSFYVWVSADYHYEESIMIFVEEQNLVREIFGLKQLRLQYSITREKKREREQQ